MTRVLVVDDESDVRLLARLILQPRGYEVVEAAGGAEAIALLRAERFDLVILDIRMPGIDGWQVLEALRKIPGLEALPVIASSAHVERRFRTRAMEAGCIEFIAKPFGPQDYLTAICNSLGAARPD